MISKELAPALGATLEVLTCLCVRTYPQKDVEKGKPIG
jgi:hypothetical protein